MEVYGDDRNLYKNAKLNHSCNLPGFQGDGGVLVEVDGKDGNLYEHAKLHHLHNLHTVDFPRDTSITFEARGEGWNNLILRTFPGGRYVYIKKNCLQSSASNSATESWPLGIDWILET